MAHTQIKTIEITWDEQIILLNALDLLPANTVGKFLKQDILIKKLETLYGKRSV